MTGKRVNNGLGLTSNWPYKSDNWNAEMDANLQRLSAMAGRVTVESRLTNVADMDKTKIYIVPSNAGSNPNAIAMWNNDPTPADQAWIYITPQPGWTAFVVNEAIPLDFLYGAWAPSQFTYADAYMKNGYDQRWLTDLTVNAAFTQNAGRQITRYRRAMTYIDLDFDLATSAAVADGVVMFTLPATYRPPKDIAMPVLANFVGAARIVIGADGTVKTYGFTNAAGYSFHQRFSLL